MPPITTTTATTAANLEKEGASSLREAEQLDQAFKSIAKSIKSIPRDLASWFTGGLIKPTKGPITPEYLKQLDKTFKNAINNLQTSRTLTKEQLKDILKYNEAELKKLGFYHEEIEEAKRLQKIIKSRKASDEERLEATKQLHEHLSRITNEIASQKSITDKLNDALGAASRELLGVSLNFKEIFSWGAIAKLFQNYAKLDKSVLKLAASYQLLGSNIKDASGKAVTSLDQLTRNMQNVQGILKVEQSIFLDYMEQMGDMAMDIQSELNKAQKQNLSSILDVSATLDRVYGEGGKEALALAGSLKQYYGFFGDAQEKAVQTTKKLADQMANARIPGKDIANTFKAIDRLLPTIAMRTMGPLSPNKVEQISSKLADVVINMRKLGIASERTAEMFEKLFDIDRLSENAFILNKMGITIGEVMYDQVAAAQKMEKGLYNITQEIKNTSNYFYRQRLLQAASAATGLSKDELLKLGSMSKEDIEKYQKKQDEIAAGKKGLAELQAMALQSLGQVLEDLKPILEAFFQAFTPFIKLIKEPLIWVAKALTGIMKSPIFPKIAQILGTVALGSRMLAGLINLFKGPRGSPTNPMYVVLSNIASGAGNFFSNIFGKGGFLGKAAGFMGKTLYTGAGGAGITGDMLTGGLLMTGIGLAWAGADAAKELKKKELEKGRTLTGGEKVWYGLVGGLTGSSATSKKDLDRKMIGSLAKGALIGGGIGMLIGGPAGAAVGAGIGVAITGTATLARYVIEHRKQIIDSTVNFVKKSTSFVKNTFEAINKSPIGNTMLKLAGGPLLAIGKYAYDHRKQIVETTTGFIKKSASLVKQTLEKVDKNPIGHFFLRGGIAGMTIDWGAKHLMEPIKKTIMASKEQSKLEEKKHKDNIEIQKEVVESLKKVGLGVEEVSLNIKENTETTDKGNKKLAEKMTPPTKTFSELLTQLHKNKNMMAEITL